MTPEEKAEGLVDKFYYAINENGKKPHSKQCALIAVDEIIGSYTLIPKRTCSVDYWQEVKQEIKKL